MKKFFMIVFLLAVVFSMSAERGAPPVAPPPGCDPGFGSVPLTFVPNRGQVDGPAAFYAQTPAYTLWLTKSGLVFDSRTGRASAFSPLVSREATRLDFVGADPDPDVTAQDPSAGTVNYIRGGDPARWLTNLPTSRAVLYRGLYKNIDLKVYGVEGMVEYDWIVAPGGRVEDIGFRFVGAAAEIDADGNLIVRARHGVWAQSRPVACQLKDGERAEVRVDFRKIGDDAFGFAASDYDAGLPLLIDPVISLKFSTMLGGNKDEAGRDVAVASTGNVFAVGETNSLDFPVRFGYSLVPAGAQDVFVTKFTVSGRDMVFSTYIGGKGSDNALGIALKGPNAFVVGSTTSADFPVKNAFDATYGGSQDAFVLKLHAAGDDLVYSTYLGGQGADAGSDIAVDVDGAAYVTGSTLSSDFPILGALDANRAGQDAFVTKLTPAGRDLVYSTFLGGAGSDEGNGIVLNRLGAAFIFGTTSSKDFPVHKAYDKSYNGNGDAFVAAIAPNGRSFLFSTYLGGAKRDRGNGIAVDSAGALYLTGETLSSDFPLKNPYDNARAGQDAFVTKMAANGQKLIYSTFLGGGKADAGQAIAVQTDGTASVAGTTLSRDFPSYGGLGNPYAGGQDAFLTKLTARGDAVLYSAYLGGKGLDAAYGIAAAADNATVLTGVTSSADFPLKYAFDRTLNGSTDAFVAKLADVNMQITNVRIRYLGMPDEVDVYGVNFGDHQGAKRLYCDGVEVPLSKTLWWGDRTISLWTSGWLYYADYWDHYYTFVIKDGATSVSNTHTQNFLVHIDAVSPNPAGTGTLLTIYGWTFNPTQGSDQLKMGSATMAISSWANTQIKAWVPAIAAGSYYIYIQRGSDIISDQYPFTKS